MTKLGLMCLAPGHNAVMPVRFEPATPRYRVKHSTTEPLRSRNKTVEPRHEKRGLIACVKCADSDQPAQTVLRYRMAGITESAMVAYTHKYAVV